MPETILRQAVRGLSNAFGFTGSRTGPPGVDLSLSAQPVVDLGGFSRYGAAKHPELADGWVVAGFSHLYPAAVGWTATSNPMDETLDPAITPGTTAYIYGVGMIVRSGGVGVLVTDFDHIILSAVSPQISEIGPGTVHEQMIFGGRVADLFLFNDQDAYLANANPLAQFRPFPLPYGGNFFWSIEQAGAAGTITIHTSVLMRILPNGVPPLP